MGNPGSATAVASHLKHELLQNAYLTLYWTFPYGNVLCEARHVVWLKCEEFCSNSVDCPQINKEGGQLTANSEVVICRWGGTGVDRQSTMGRICREVEICRWGRGSIDSQLGKDLQRLEFVDGEGGRGGVDQQSTWEGSAERLKFVGEKGEEGVDQQSTWEGSTKTLEGLPLTILILGGSIDSQLGKDLQRLWKDYL